MRLFRWFPVLVLCAGLAFAGVSGMARAQDSAPPADTSDETGRPHIFMILWRGETEVEQGFRAYLAENGIDARITVRSIERDRDKIPGFVAEAKAERPDIVYTWGTSTTLGVVGTHDGVDPDTHITDLPVVFTMVSAPFKTGIAPPPGAPPRPNVTGTSHIAPLRAQIRAIRAYIPMTELGIVYNPEEANSRTNVADLEQLGQSLGFSVLKATPPKGPDGNPDPASVPDLVADLAARGADVLYIGPDNFVGAVRDSLTAAGISHGIPAFTATELEIRDSNAMFGLVSRYDMVGRLAAAQVRRVLIDGVSPSDIPVQTLDRFTYLIKFPVARALDLYPPLLMLDYAEIITDDAAVR